ncbi:zf-HC2 domain-containing protein [Foetidibacter luteolus]|uniref:anti-sigma factor family protein n=1 Tax=Foetidibacter luteolus TaxID=2608880 RepID=UPI00129ADE86|nr:zf-HC2 domain-containing protein [Foetidibacter luteolus]
MSKLRKSCRQATYLLGKKEEGQLTFKERLVLALHLALCDMCRLFEKQLNFVRRNAKQLHEHTHHQLPQQSKQKIKAALKDAGEGGTN